MNGLKMVNGFKLDDNVLGYKYVDSIAAVQRYIFVIDRQRNLSAEQNAAKAELTA